MQLSTAKRIKSFRFFLRKNPSRRSTNCVLNADAHERASEIPFLGFNFPLIEIDRNEIQSFSSLFAECHRRKRNLSN